MNRIKDLRKQKNLSLEQLSDKLKESGKYLSASSLSKYERGVRNPKIENWVTLAKFFGVSVAYLKGEKHVGPHVEMIHLKKYDGSPLVVDPNIVRKLRQKDQSLLSSFIERLNATLDIDSVEEYDHPSYALAKTMMLLTLDSEMRNYIRLMSSGEIDNFQRLSDEINYVVENPGKLSQLLDKESPIIDMDTMRPQD